VLEEFESCGCDRGAADSSLLEWFFWLFRTLFCNKELEYSKRETGAILRLAEASFS
jgi:hypothetical protein